MKENQMEASERPWETQRLKKEKLEEGWSERKSRQKKNYAWTGANASAKEVPVLCNVGTNEAHMGCNALSQDQMVHYSRDEKFQHKYYNWDSMKGLPRYVLDCIR